MEVHRSFEFCVLKANKFCNINQLQELLLNSRGVSFFSTSRTDSCLHRDTCLKECKYSRLGIRHIVLWDSACGSGGMSADTKPGLMPGILQNAQNCLFCKIISKWHYLWVMLNLPPLKASKLKFSRALCTYWCSTAGHRCQNGKK